MDAFADSLARSPEMFPLALDLPSDTVTLVRLRRPDYTAASFLDERLLTPGVPRRTASWQHIQRAVSVSPLSERCHYIFHLGHVGSTLLSRLLANDPRILALREPAILRTLALAAQFPDVAGWGAEGFENRLTTCLKLWSRTFDASEQVCLKATSHVSEFAPELLSRPHQPRAILMYSAPEPYLAAILGAPNSPQEIRTFASDRLKRLERRLGTALSPVSAMKIGEIVAMSWACEMTALMNAKRAAGERAIYFDFDAFLTDPTRRLAGAFTHFELAVSDAELETILEGPDMRRYSKAPEHAYDAGLRLEVLKGARRLNADDIRAGLIWLKRMAAAFAPIAAALDLAGKT